MYKIKFLLSYVYMCALYLEFGSIHNFMTRIKNSKGKASYHKDWYVAENIY